MLFSIVLFIYIKVKIYLYFSKVALILNGKKRMNISFILSFLVPLA